MRREWGFTSPWTPTRFPKSARRAANHGFKTGKPSCERKSGEVARSGGGTILDLCIRYPRSAFMGQTAEEDRPREILTPWRNLSPFEDLIRSSMRPGNQEMSAGVRIDEGSKERPGARYSETLKKNEKTEA